MSQQLKKSRQTKHFVVIPEVGPAVCKDAAHAQDLIEFWSIQGIAPYELRMVKRKEFHVNKEER